MVWQYPLAIGVGYLAGSIPFGWIAGKLTRGIDVRDYGSGATGATNVLRTLGVWPFLLVLVADALKAYLPVLATWYIAEPHVGSETAHGLQVAVGVAAIVGHDWPVYIGWRGGKGVAPSYGAMAGLLFPLSLGLVVLAILIILTFRYMSLMSVTTIPMGSAILVGLAIAGRAPVSYGVFGVLATLLVLFRHRDNIRRLLAGQEPKIGQGGRRRAQRSPQRVRPSHRM
jgi:glycerol-3-phosphate acyltransferase PlsY